MQTISKNGIKPFGTSYQLLVFWMNPLAERCPVSSKQEIPSTCLEHDSRLAVLWCEGVPWLQMIDTTSSSSTGFQSVPRGKIWRDIFDVEWDWGCFEYWIFFSIIFWVHCYYHTLAPLDEVLQQVTRTVTGLYLPNSSRTQLFHVSPFSTRLLLSHQIAPTKDHGLLGLMEGVQCISKLS